MGTVVVLKPDCEHGEHVPLIQGIDSTGDPKLEITICTFCAFCGEYLEWQS